MTTSMASSAKSDAAAPAVSPADCAILTSGFSLWYGDFQALIDVSACIKPRRITGLIGPSGCGKTTLLRSFNRMNERFPNVRTSGEITILGKNILDSDVSLIELRQAVGMVFQRPNPLPLSIYENVVFGLRIHSAAESLCRAEEKLAVEKALREVFLWDAVKDRLGARATELQLEQQQKLCIARLLPLKPDILLMDEPCSALDAEATRAVEDLLDTLRTRYTIVIVTHNMAQARRVSDECIFMLSGRLVEQSPTVELFINPRDQRTEEYIEGRYG
jgi:phosphate transport system ATP-binding protein